MKNSRLKSCFDRLRTQGQKALVPYVTAGDPDPEKVVELLLTIARSGADVIELGIPFSDPMADGPVIQRSSERALSRGVNLAKCMDWVEKFRLSNQTTPVVMMGYANPIEKFGVNKFASRAERSGVDGVLVVDYPPEECVDFCNKMKSHNVDVIFLLAPTTSLKRLNQIASLGSGYLYYVSLRGVTGASNIDILDVADRIKTIKNVTDLPVIVGFGISNPDSAAEVASTGSDGVVIGSAIIDKLDKAHRLGKNPLQEVSSFLKEIKKEMKTSVRINS